MDPKFHKFLYIIAFFALVIAIITIYEGMSEINKFFNERIKSEIKKFFLVLLFCL